MKTFPRVVTAMITPFNDDYSINYQGVQELANYLLANGSEGLVVAGTTGESPTLSIKEKIELYSLVKETVGEQAYVIAGTGTNNTKDAIEMTEAAEKIGVDAVMAVVPYYNRPNQEGLYQHYKALASCTSKPVMMYNVPSRTGVNLLPETVARLAEIKNIKAVKEACGNLDQISLLKSILPEDFLIYSGDDSLTLPMLSVGAYGVVSVATHVAGKMINEMIYTYVDGRVEDAARLHIKLFPLFKNLFITTNPIPVKKAAQLCGLPSGRLRLPMVEANAQETAIVRDTLMKLNLL